MRLQRASRLLTLAWALAGAAVHAAPTLNLQGYGDGRGAITVVNAGESADPYFALQALLLALDNGLNISAPAEKFVEWLLPRQKPDGTFDRFCRLANGDWLACKTADADDSLLALWMRLLDTMPQQLAARPAWARSHDVARQSLAKLFQPSRGVYMVSPVYLHGLFMDNLEVWSWMQHRKPIADAPGQAGADQLAASIRATFWLPAQERFMVSTQLEQRSRPPAFYPDHVAQIFPVLVGFPVAAPSAYYQDWMARHRGEWLRHSHDDYPWGIIAVAALRQGDEASVRCWLREASGKRHSARWAVTDEVALQIVEARGLQSAPPGVACQ